MNAFDELDIDVRYLSEQEMQTRRTEANIQRYSGKATDENVKNAARRWRDITRWSA